jgi:hypothetical protein
MLDGLTPLRGEFPESHISLFRFLHQTRDVRSFLEKILKVYSAVMENKLENIDTDGLKISEAWMLVPNFLVLWYYDVEMSNRGPTCFCCILFLLRSILKIFNCMSPYTTFTLPYL